jgi:hypothetical protein
MFNREPNAMISDIFLICFLANIYPESLYHISTAQDNKQHHPHQLGRRKGREGEGRGMYKFLAHNQLKRLTGDSIRT